MMEARCRVGWRTFRRANLEYYLGEVTFRFNRRGSRSRGLLFYRLLEQAVQTGHTPTHALFKATGRGVRR